MSCLILQTDRRRNCLRHQDRVSQRSEFHQPDAVLEVIKQVDSNFKREAGLAHAGCSNQSEQTRGGQKALDLRLLAFASNKAGQVQGKISE
jgi:hypothetical protein